MHEGIRIKIRREELGMTQEELAKKLGYKNRSSINKIELGERRLTQTKIVSIANILGVSPLYILGMDEHTSGSIYSMTSEEQDLILAYRRADDATKQIIRKILDVDLPAEKRNESIS